MFAIQKANFIERGLSVTKGQLLIAVEGGSDLVITEGRIYVALSNQGEGTFHDCVFIVNDNGEQQDISVEYFAPYEGEIVTSQSSTVTQEEEDDEPYNEEYLEIQREQEAILAAEKRAYAEVVFGAEND